MTTPYSQYSTAVPFMSSMPTWIPQLIDQQRFNSYLLYEQIYKSVPNTFALKQRGTDSDPIYLPAPKTIIESVNRFLAVGLDFYVDPKVGTAGDQAIAQGLLTKLFAREKMYAKLATQKRYGLIRGDAVWHIVADPLKPAGSRISVYEVDPSAYFPIEDPDQPGHVTGCHLVTQETDLATKKTYVRRRTYRKDPASGLISSELILFETTGWDDRSLDDPQLKQVQVVDPLHFLPPSITALPVYHVANNREPESLFGSSELAGFERVIAAVNQAVSDEELALALTGLGLYYTTSGPPVNDKGEETNWQLGPGRVVEGDPESVFERVAGVTSVTPSLDHINFLLGSVYEAAGVSAIARGNVEVKLAESGIALYLELAPLLAKNAEKENEMLPVLDHMLYDIVHGWLPGYEQTGDLDADAGMLVQDPMPQNRDAKVKEVLSLLAAQVISAQYARMELSKLGYDFPPEMAADILAEQEAASQVQAADPFLRRVVEELDREDGTQS